MSVKWQTKPLKDYCSDYKSGIVDGPFGSNLKKEHFTSEGVPVLKIQNIKISGINNKNLNYVSKDKAEELKRHSFNKLDIIMTKLGNPLGISAIVNDIEEGVIVADLVRIRADKIDTKFLCYQLNSPIIRNFINSKQKGATRPRVKLEVVRNLPISTPSLPEQKRIVAILDKAFEGIDTAIANTEKNLANARELFESYLDSVFTDKQEGWENRTFGDKDLLTIIDGDRGHNYPKKSDFTESGYCLFLSTKNVRENGFRFDDLMFISKEKDSLLRKGKIKRQDVIMTTRGTIGNIALYDDSVEFNEIRINSGMLIFRVNQQAILPEYLFEILRSSIVKRQIKNHVSGAAQPQLPIKTIVNFTIPVPVSLDKQREIVADLKNIYQSSEQLYQLYQQKLDSLSELKQSILKKAFSGELTTIKDDELRTEEVA